MIGLAEKKLEEAAPILTFSDVSVRYGAFDAVSNISFSIAQADYFCLLGENGSGKTSLIKAAMGLLPVSHGKIDFSIARDHVSYLPQISTTMDGFPATVREIVISGRQRPKACLPLYSKEDKYAAESAMELFSIKDLSNKRIAALSGGQRQRVFLARAICKDPQILILDEPANALDIDIMDQLYDLLQKLNQEKGIAIVMISHDRDHVAKYAKHVAILKKQLSFYGTVDEWKRRELA